jgi:hypothetical protein
MAPLARERQQRLPMKLDAAEMHYVLGLVHDEYRHIAWNDVAPSV